MAKHDRTLRAIFAEPVPANLGWSEVESLLVHLGARLREGDGSRVRFTLGARRATFHRPHPRKEASRATIRDVRKFLEEAGFEAP